MSSGSSFASRPHRLASLVVSVMLPLGASAQIAGESVNMVSGTQWPGGDPFLQRQNEPSIAVSSANPQHLLAGANDYRTVDIPDPFLPGEQRKMAGDAWQGVFKSYDGGQTWKSYLMPGYPQDTSADGLGSAAQFREPDGRARYNAAADSVVRAGTDGMFYFAGIVFKRGSSDGRVVLNRFIDLNDKEGGDVVGGTDPIRWIDAKVVDQGGTYFADKPWIAVDVPRAGALTCNIQRFGRSFPGGAIYVVWARIYGDTYADIMFSRSLDCGDTWSAPLKLNDQKSQASQGASVSVDPRTGYVYVAWRRFGIPGASPKQDEDAIFAVRSFSMGQKFTSPRLVTTFVPFEQGQGSLRFRTEAFPTVASSVDATGTRSWTHVAWAQRGANGDGQIVTTAVIVSAPPKSYDEWNDPLDGWQIPASPVDVAPVVDGPGGNAFTRGHQFMPTLTFSQGKLVVVYYDSRLDHTRTFYSPHQSQDPCQPVGSCWAPNPEGRWYDEERGPVGERTGIDWTTLELDDSLMTQKRHTIDVRMAMADASANPVFTSATLSRLPFGERGDELDLHPGGVAPGFDGPIEVVDLAASPKPALRRLQDLQVNPPNLPMFKNGTTAFIGDYIDVQGPMFVRTATGWSFNTAPTSAPVFHAVWTSNQDVVPPLGGDWTKYTPPARAAGTVSVYDPGQTLQSACDPRYTGTRNQNIYTARVSDGLVVSSPQNAKVLPTYQAGASNQRTYVVSAFNATGSEKWFTFSLGAVPAGVRASLRPDGAASTTTVKIPARSSAVQTVFMSLLEGTSAASGNPATMVVNVNEVGGPLGGFVTLNPPGLTFGTASLADGEKLEVQLSAASLYYANLSNANLSNANLSNANLSNANLSNANLSNANLSNANLSNADPSAFTLEAAHLSNANLSNTDLANANLSNANLSNANLSNANLSNANLSNANLSNAALADIDYTVTNTGNTTQGFDVRLLTTTGGSYAPVQLVVSRPYGKPIAVGCELQEQPDNQIVVNAGTVDPTINPGAQAPLASFAMAPGETVRVTLRTYLSPYDARTLATVVAPVVSPQGNPFNASTALIVTRPVGTETARVGTPYLLDLQASGGIGQLTWSLAEGSSLPPGFDAGQLSQGKLAGTPTQAGTYTFTLQVVDTATPLANQMFKDVTLVVQQGATTSTLAPSNATPVFGETVTLTATVAPSVGPTGTVTFLEGTTTLGTATVTGGAASLVVPAAALATLPLGVHTFTASYSGDSAWSPSTAGATSVTVSKATTSLALVTGGGTSYGQQATFTAQASTAAPGAGTPAGSVEFREGTTVLGTVSLTSGTATFQTSTLAGGAHTIVAAFLGSQTHANAESAPASQVVARATATVSVSVDPASLVYGLTVPVVATVGPAPAGASPPSGTVYFLDGTTLLGSATLSGGSATFYAMGLGGGIHPLSASYDGDGNYAGPVSGAASPVPVVARAAVTVDVTTVPNPSSYGQSVSVTAHVTSAAGIPGGTVSFYRDVSVPLGTAVLDATGFATLSTAAIPGGTHPVSAYYEGSPNFASTGSSISANQTVGAAATSASLSSSPNPSGPGAPVTLSCTVTSLAGQPTGSVQFRDGAVLLATVTSAAPANTWTTTTSALASGIHSLSCAYLGDGNFASSSSAAISQQVGTIATTTSVTATPTTATYGQTVNLRATIVPASAASVAPSGTVTFLDGTTTLGTAPLASGAAVLAVSTLKVGAHPITARYSGDPIYAGSTSATPASVTIVSVYKFTGFLTPLKTAGTLASPTNSGSQNFGSAIPIKWQLQDASGAYVGDLATTTSLVAYPNKACAGPPPAGSSPIVLYMPTSGATGGSTFRYGTNAFIFNWDTSSGVTKGCFDIVLTLGDGTVKATLITLK